MGNHKNMAITVYYYANSNKIAENKKIKKIKN